jgi:TrmH family RNA methyltransferase
VQEGSLIARFGRARRDPRLAVLEGLHPLKHALRFGAEVDEVVCLDVERLVALAEQLAPDQTQRIRELAHAVAPDEFAQLAPLPPTTGVIALAERRQIAAADALTDTRAAPLVLLEDPRDLGNMGACVRVAAAADAAGVLTTGSHDPWAPDALRGAAGLHYALPVTRLRKLDDLADGGRPLLALDPEGEPLAPSELPSRAVLAFGTERVGLSAQLLERADARIGIPMRAGVSSLNLATSVAAVLFAWRLSNVAAAAGGAPTPPATSPGATSPS